MNFSFKFLALSISDLFYCYFNIRFIHPNLVLSLNRQVGLALVVEGEVALGIMGCPNWKNDHAKTDDDDDGGERSKPSSQGMIMIAHVGRGTWVRQLPASTDSVADSLDGWKKCYVDPCSTMNHAVFLIPESQKWESLPLSGSHGVTYDASKSKNEDKITLLKVCCGRYLMFQYLLENGIFLVLILYFRIHENNDHRFCLFSM